MNTIDLSRKIKRLTQWLDGQRLLTASFENASTALRLGTAMLPSILTGRHGSHPAI
jgi:hypothetical protein